MRRILLIGLCAMVLAAMVPAVLAADEKGPDTRNYKGAVTSGTQAGDLVNTQVFDRRLSVTYTGNCAATSSDSSNNGTAYQVFQFHSPGGQMADIWTTQSGTLTDSVIFIYCDPFNPLSPDLNLVAWDDDDGAGLMSAITTADGVQLQPNTTYNLVVTGYFPTSLGTYTVDLGGDLVFGPAAPIPSVNTWGLAALAAILGAAGFLALRSRLWA